MKDLLKKTILIGAGLASITKDKIEEIANDLVKKGELTEKEGRDLIDDLFNKSKEARKDLEAKIEKLVDDILTKCNIPTRKEFQELKQRVAALEKENMVRVERDTEEKI